MVPFTLKKWTLRQAGPDRCEEQEAPPGLGWAMVPGLIPPAGTLPAGKGLQLETLTPKPSELTPWLLGNYIAQVSGAKDRAWQGRQYIILDTAQPSGAA